MTKVRFSPLFQFILAAIFARTATGGAAVAVILLARDYGANGKLVGMLAACLTLPHLLGPVYGRWIEKVARPKILIAVMTVVFIVCFQLAIVGFKYSLTWMFTAALIICGIASSFIMGGLSTQLMGLVGTHQHARRKAQGWDTITYAIGTTLGPLLMAILADMYEISTAAAIVMAFPIFSVGLILTFPSVNNAASHAKEALPNMHQVYHLLKNSPALKRTILMTSGASFSVAALPVLAVYLGEAWQNSKESGALLVTAYGLGNLVGALFLILRPLKKEALLLLRNVGLLLLLSLVLITLSQSFYSGLLNYWLVGVINAIFFAVTLAARSEYAPEKGAAQIYMWVAAAKIGAASLGAIAAGYLVDLSLNKALWLTSSLLAVSLVTCFWFKKISNKSLAAQQ